MNRRFYNAIRRALNDAGIDYEIEWYYDDDDYDDDEEEVEEDDK